MQLKKKEKEVKGISPMDLCIILGIKEANQRSCEKKEKEKKSFSFVFLD